MAAVDGGYSNLIQGVSQQDRSDRLPGQCTEQENMTSDVVRGLRRRVPTSDIASLFTSGTDYQFHDFDIDETTYIAATAAGDLKVFTADTGAEHTVTSTALSYVGADMAGAVVDNTMYFANTATETAMQSTLNTQTPYAIVQILGGLYGRKFEIELYDPVTPGTPILITHTTPDGTTTSDVYAVASDVIAAAIMTQALTLPAFNASYIMTRNADVLLIGWLSGSATDRIDISGSDGEAGTLMVTMADRTDNTDQLPKYAPNDHVIQVTGLDTADADNTYFRFDQEVAGFGKEGLWIETFATDVEYMWDLTTMPHTLVHNSDDTFTFAQGAWEDRRVGDDVTNKPMSFLGNAIKDISSFQKRLTVLSKESVCMTRTDKPLDFWRQTATTQTDSDPLDMSSTASGGKSLRWLQEHDRDMVVFADKAQFIIFGRNSLTPKNAGMVFTTGFEIEPGARPSVSGKNIFFAFNSGTYTGIKEFFTEGAADINDSRPITAHADKYIDGTAAKLTSSSNFDILVVHADHSHDLYVYEFVWQGTEKVQASWSEWVFDKEVVYSWFVESELYLIVLDGTTYRLIKGDLDIRPDTDVGYTVCLDRKTSVTSGTDVYTTIYANDIDDVVAVQGTGCPNPGLTAEIISRSGADITLSSDIGAGTVIFGVPYASSYMPTMPMRKDRNGVKIGTGEFIVDHFLVSYKDTGLFQTTVSSDYYDDVTDSFEGYIADSPSAILGTQPIVSGTFVLDFADDADQAEVRFHTNSHLPFTLLDLEYVGQFEKLGRRVS